MAWGGGKVGTQFCLLPWRKGLVLYPRVRLVEEFPDEPSKLQRPPPQRPVLTIRDSTSCLLEVRIQCSVLSELNKPVRATSPSWDLERGRELPMLFPLQHSTDINLPYPVTLTSLDRLLSFQIYFIKSRCTKWFSSWPWLQSWSTYCISES